MEVILISLSILFSLRCLLRVKIWERIPYSIILSAGILFLPSLPVISIGTFSIWVIYARYFFLTISNWTTVNTACFWTGLLSFVLASLSFNIWYRSAPLLIFPEILLVSGILAYIRYFIR